VAKPGSPKTARRDQRSSHKELKSLPFLSSWRPAALLVIIIVGAVLVDTYVSKENIPQQVAQQQETAVPQQPAGANMAVLPQIEDMERHVKANPDDLGMTLQLANFLSDNRFYDKAITYYQAYLKKKPKDTNARVDMGICYKEVGQYDNAVREMKQALVYDPTHLFATFNLGIVDLDEGKMYMDQGQMDKANELIQQSNDWFKKTVALAPTSEVGKRAQQLLSQHSNTQLPSSN
jgi:tetratricopeptide (TPR) repeat protein